MTSRRSVLADRTYRHLFGAQVVALLGTGLLTVALSLLAFDVAPRAAGTVVATALSIKMLAYVLVAPVVATLVARWRPRTVLVVADVVRAVVACSLPWVEEVWQVYLLIFVLQSASATFTPAFQALVPEVLPDEDDYTRALSLSRLAYDLEAVVSPVAAAALLLVTSFHGLFVGTAVGFVVSTVLVVRAGVPTRRGTVGEDGFWRRVSLGSRMFVRRRPLRALLALYLATATVTALVLVDTVVVVRQDLGRGSASVALVLAAFGSGSMVVALLVPAVLRWVAVRTLMLTGGALVPAALLAAALAAQSSSLPWVATAWALLGAADAMVLTPSGRVVAAEVVAADRPAAFAASFSLSHACFLLAYPAAGWWGSALGVPVTAVLLAGVAAGAAVVAVLTWTRGDVGQRGRGTSRSGSPVSVSSTPPGVRARATQTSAGSSR